MKISSPAFAKNQDIPNTFSAYFDNSSPPLDIDDVPTTSQSLVLIMEDPDAPTLQPWQHWLVWNISPKVKHIKENSLPPESVEGLNDSGQLGYFGPKPPSGIHRYVFSIFALDCNLTLKSGSTRQQLNLAIKGHIVDQATLIGRFKAI